MERNQLGHGSRLTLGGHSSAGEAGKLDVRSILTAFSSIVTLWNHTPSILFWRLQLDFAQDCPPQAVQSGFYSQINP